MTSLAELGAKLKEARESSGLTLEQVSHQLKIQVKVLDSLEKGVIPEHIPRAIFKGFLKSYGRLVKVEIPDSVLQESLALDKAIIKKTSNIPRASTADNNASLKLGWLKWGLGLAILMLLLVSVKTYRKYRTEKMRALELQKTLIQEDNAQMASVSDGDPKISQPPSPPTNNHNDQLNAFNQTESGATLKNPSPNSAPGPSSAPSPDPSPNPSHSQSNTSSHSSQQTGNNNPVGENSLNSRVIELAIQVFKPTQISLSQGGGSAQTWDLQPRKIYLVTTQAPASLKIKDPQSIRVFKNGRLISVNQYDPKSHSFQFSE
ncbi:MAG: helix-turn-helix domain-containing protein [Bdellovibrionaceae bacterium]|nr:helix-turn-helix domain-containing protein [Pseudobdellovibrionaceae bacterium]MDW8189440.1 helix-turn-helix transcriptional regulator [Pseudobdellovibrionaceae bacterium]